MPIAHGGYARYRKDLLRLGVELFELRPLAGQKEEKERASWGGSSGAALHAKTFILDRKWFLLAPLTSTLGRLVRHSERYRRKERNAGRSGGPSL